MPDFFRNEEVLLIKYGDMNFHSGYVISNLKVSKTDQLRKGYQVVIAESSNDDTCPVKIFKRYLSHLESSPVDPSHYVFRALSKTRSGHTLVSINKPISYSSVRDFFKSTLGILYLTLLCLVRIHQEQEVPPPLLMQVWLTSFFRGMVDGSQCLLRMVMLRIVWSLDC